MLDLSTPKGRIIAAAMRLAGNRPWNDVSLRDIAEAGGMTLADLKGELLSKGAILAEFVRLVNTELLRRAPKRAEGQSARDAIFDVVMSRFDILAPYRSALKSIVRSRTLEPAMVKGLCEAQTTILEAAGVSSEGLRGAVRTVGLASVYASVFHTWLDDEDPGFARTMAALDRRLRRGEQNLSALEEACSTACRVASIFVPGARKRETAAPTPAPEAPTSPAI